MNFYEFPKSNPTTELLLVLVGIESCVTNIKFVALRVDVIFYFPQLKVSKVMAVPVDPRKSIVTQRQAA